MGADHEFFFQGEPETRIHPSARDSDAQDELLAAYADRTGDVLPALAS